ncbi:MAG: FAD binding domain-containing protein [Spirochaetales bacterium]|nr:FAD binding domain-containing protein [Spirochaetales bacterium]
MLHEFSYIEPGSLSELLEFLAKYGPESAVFSGGTDLLISIRAGLEKPVYVVDLKKVPELQELNFGSKSGLSIGAAVNVNRVVEHEAVQSHYRILEIAGRELATFQLRNRATVIGNIVTASPCGDMSSPLLCLDAEVELLSASGSRSMLLKEFITGVKKTQIKPEEIVSKITVPTTFMDAAGGYEKLKRIKGHDLGVVAVTMIKTKKTMRVAVSSAAPTPVLLPDFVLDTPVAEIQKVAQAAISPIDDVRCTKEYRRFMVDIYIRRLLEEVQHERGAA